jgi:hypothetical protein
MGFQPVSRFITKRLIVTREGFFPANSNNAITMITETQTLRHLTKTELLIGNGAVY